MEINVCTLFKRLRTAVTSLAEITNTNHWSKFQCSILINHLDDHSAVIKTLLLVTQACAYEVIGVFNLANKLESEKKYNSEKGE